VSTDPQDHRDGDHAAAADDGAATPDADDTLALARSRLESVDDLPVTRRPEVFAEINAAIAEELATMDEV
jgi:hypothetical protein